MVNQKSRVRPLRKPKANELNYEIEGFEEAPGTGLHEDVQRGEPKHFC